MVKAAAAMATTICCSSHETFLVSLLGSTHRRGTHDFRAPLLLLLLATKTTPTLPMFWAIFVGEGES